MNEGVSKCEQISILASKADWAWPTALADIFRPRGINMMVARSSADFADILENTRVHTAIVDVDSDSSGLATVSMVRKRYPMLPCILLSGRTGGELLSKALQMQVFAVIDKPVDMKVLTDLLNRLFIKKYNCHVFQQ